MSKFSLTCILFITTSSVLARPINWNSELVEFNEYLKVTNESEPDEGIHIKKAIKNHKTFNLVQIKFNEY